MKIGIVCPYDIVRNGGVQEHVLAQARELQRRGHNVTVLTPKPRGQELADSLLQQPVPVIFIGSSRMVRTPYKTSLELGASFKPDQVDAVLEKEQFDVLHIHEPEVPVLGAQIVAKATCPIVATFHAMHPPTTVSKTLETLRVPYSRSIFSKLTTLTAVSDAAADFIRQHTDRPVEIIPNGIDLDKYQWSPKRNSDEMFILYIGRLEKRKGVRYLLKAYQQLVKKQPNVQLVIAGDGPLRESLENYVHENGLKQVSFLGFIEEDHKIDLLGRAQLFCSPAIYGESFGIVLLEAMARGTVILAGDNVGYSSVLRGSGSLALVDSKDTPAFVRQLDLLLNDQAVRELWLKWAHSQLSQYDYRKIVDKYEALYRQTVKTARDSTTAG